MNEVKNQLKLAYERIKRYLIFSILLRSVRVKKIGLQQYPFESFLNNTINILTREYFLNKKG